MARKKKGDDHKDGSKPHVAARIPADLLAKIDALALKLSTEWSNVTRSGVLRMMLVKGFEAFEREQAEREQAERELAEAEKAEK